MTPLYVPTILLLLPLFIALFSPSQCELSKYASLHCAFILTDNSNEPDDQMNLVQLLTHANEISIEDIAAMTSTRPNSTTDDPFLRAVVKAYGTVVANLTANAPVGSPEYPSAEDFLDHKIHTGPPVYELTALTLDLSGATEALIAATGASDSSLWALDWGGINALAEALQHISSTRSSAETAAFVDKLRVHSISDQDDTGA